MDSSRTTEREPCASDNKFGIVCSDFESQEASERKTRKFKIVIKRKALYSEVASEEMVVSDCKRQKPLSPGQVEGLNMEICSRLPEEDFAASCKAYPSKSDITFAGLNSAIGIDSPELSGRSGDVNGLSGSVRDQVVSLVSSRAAALEQSMPCADSFYQLHPSVPGLVDSTGMVGQYSPSEGGGSVGTEELSSKLICCEQTGGDLFGWKDEAISPGTGSVTHKAKRTPLAIPSVLEPGGSNLEGQAVASATVLPAKRSPLPLPSAAERHRDHSEFDACRTVIEAEVRTSELHVEVLDSKDSSFELSETINSEVLIIQQPQLHCQSIADCMSEKPIFYKPVCSDTCQLVSHVGGRELLDLAKSGTASGSQPSTDVANQYELPMLGWHNRAVGCASSDYDGTVSMELSGTMEHFPVGYCGERPQSGSRSSSRQSEDIIQEDGDVSSTKFYNRRGAVYRCNLLSQSMATQPVLKLKIKPPTDCMILEAPTTAKSLLATGLVEGHHVSYRDRAGVVMLTGVVRKNGILCDCSGCQGREIVNVSAFEKHAGSSARHPSDFICLENGNSLHDVLEAGWKAGNPGKIKDALKIAIGQIQGGTSESCTVCKHNDGQLVPCIREYCPHKYHPECVGDLLDPGGEHRTCLSCLSAEKYKEAPCPNSSGRSRPSASLPDYVVHSRVRDTNAALHKALFLPGGLPDESEVAYYMKGQRLLKGFKRGVGICCSCCNQVVSCSQFEQHAGMGSRRNPYNSIYLVDGRSLHEAAEQLFVKDKVNSVDNDSLDNYDHCVECGDGGELVLCDGCPGAYHADCLLLDTIPDGDWYCPSCEDKRSTTGILRKNPSRRRERGSFRSFTVAGTKERNPGRCSRLLKAAENVGGGCVLCSEGDFSKSGFGSRTIMLCDQCEREFHVGCLRKHGLEDLKELPNGEWFCCKACGQIHSTLQLLVNSGQRPLVDIAVVRVPAAEETAAQFSWQLLHGRNRDPPYGRTLDEAITIFTECFDPIIDSSSGRDLIPLMVHSRSIRDQEFGGMFCMVLKHNDTVVSAAIIRVFGRQLAEMPLIATSADCWGQGFCQALMLSIERLLGMLRVKLLVLPAAEGAEGIWLNKFGFKHMAGDQLQRLRSEVQMMTFAGSSIMQKAISALDIIPSQL